jgi:hypothetical protein
MNAKIHYIALSFSIQYYIRTIFLFYHGKRPIKCDDQSHWSLSVWQNPLIHMRITFYSQEIIRNKRQGSICMKIQGE